MLEQNPEEKEEQIISEATMSKSIDELQTEESQLAEAVKNLTNSLEDTKKNNPTDFESFKSINGKLRGSQKLLEEVRVALAIKAKENEPDEFTKSVERENGGALRKMERRTGN